MGSCGCGDVDGARWAVTVGGRVLVLSEYDGCNNGCDAPLGFELQIMTKTEAKRWWDIKPTGEWKPGDDNGSRQFLNFFSQAHLADAAREIEKEEPFDLSDYDSLGDLLEEIGLNLMRRAWGLCQAEEAELTKRFGNPPPFGPATPPREAGERREG
jgi:hypothetical protein